MNGTHSKYGYSPTEQFFMLIVTGITNFSCIPSLIHIYRRKWHFEALIAILTMVTSFLYHSMDSVDITDLFLSDLQWHRLDNIGSIECFCMLMVYLMDNQNPELDIQLNMGGLFLALICQEKAPWEIVYTAFPILIFLTCLLVTICARPRKPKYNKKMLLTGIFCFFCAFIGFFKGLDEYKDYLRMWHGGWHMMIGFGSFFIWQAKTALGDEIYFSNLFTKPIKDTYRKYSQL